MEEGRLFQHASKFAEGATEDNTSSESQEEDEEESSDKTLNNLPNNTLHQCV